MSTRPIGTKALRQFLDEAIRKGYYGETDHAESGHPERNISIEDIIHGLRRKGWVEFRPAEFCEEFENWKHYIQTADIDGEELKLVVGIFLGSKRFEVVTRF